jgi:hypothetical protein
MTSVLDLRSLTELSGTHIKLNPYQETIFKVAKSR